MKDGVPTLRNTMDVLRDLADVYNSLPDNSAEKQGLISSLGGKYHANSLSALLSRWDMYEKMLGEFSQGTGSALEEANKTADSWEGRLAQLQNSWDSFINSLTNKDVIKGGVSFLDNTIQAFEKLTETVGALPVLLTSVNASMSALNKNYGITQIYNKDTHKLDLQGNFMGIDITGYKTQVKHFREAEIAMTSWNNSLVDGTANINTFNNATVQNNEQLRAYLQTTSVDAPASLNGYRAYLNAAGVNTDALRLKTVLLTSAMSLGLSIGIQAAVTGISKLVRAQEEMIQSAKEAADAYKDFSLSINDYVSRYQELRDALLKAKGNEQETYNVKKQLLELQTDLNEKFGDEYGAINLVTEAYKDQTQAIKALNKETAQIYLNENKAGIDKAVKEMTKDNRHYNLSYTGMVATTDKGATLKEIAEKYAEQGMSILDEGDGGVTFSVHLYADAQSAYDTINAFENDIRNKAKELGNEHMFDDVLSISSNALNNAKKTIDKYGDIFKQALTAEIASDDDKAKMYGEALKAVEDYNDAVLRSEDVYNDGKVMKAKDSLDTIKNSIQGNNEEWGKYSVLFDEVFSQADTRLLEFNEALKNDSGLQKLAGDLKGLYDLDLKALDANIGENESFDKLKESAHDYKLETDELIDALIRLGYVQGEIQNSISDETVTSTPSITDTINQLNTQLKPTFDSLKSAYQDIFTTDDNGKPLFTLENVDLSMLDSIKSAIDDINKNEELGIHIDYSEFENLASVLTDTSSTADDVHNAFNSFATEIVGSLNPAISSCTGENYKLVKSLLESMGIVNAEAVMISSMGYSYDEYTMAKEECTDAGRDLTSMTEDEINEFILEQVEAGNSVEALANLQLKKLLVNDTKIDTSSDIQQIMNLASAAGVGADVLVKLANAKSVLAAVENGESVSLRVVENALSDVENARQGLIDWEPAKVDFSPKNTSKSKKSGSKKKEEDKWLEEYKKKLAELQNILDKGRLMPSPVVIQDAKSNYIG